MKYLNWINSLVSVLITILYVPIAYAAPAVPSGRSLSIDDILSLSENFGGFLFVLAGILAGIAIVMSGVSYLTAGGNQNRVKLAKDILKAGVIGAFVIFGSGVIISTIRLLAQDPLRFFR